MTEEVIKDGALTVLKTLTLLLRLMESRIMCSLQTEVRKVLALQQDVQI